MRFIFDIDAQRRGLPAAAEGQHAFFVTSGGHRPPLARSARNRQAVPVLLEYAVF
jgi:hypothetical protein